MGRCKGEEEEEEEEKGCYLMGRLLFDYLKQVYIVEK